MIKRLPMERKCANCDSPISSIPYVKIQATGDCLCSQLCLQKYVADRIEKRRKKK